MSLLNLRRLLDGVDSAYEFRLHFLVAHRLLKRSNLGFQKMSMESNPCTNF